MCLKKVFESFEILSYFFGSVKKLIWLFCEVNTFWDIEFGDIGGMNEWAEVDWASELCLDKNNGLGVDLIK